MTFLSRLRDSAFYKNARSRLGKVDQSQVVLWANSGLWAVQEQLDVYMRTKEPAALEEARKGAVGVLAAVDDLLDRHR